jgi:hypothetical protein
MGLLYLKRTMIKDRPKTIFCDIDGTLLEQSGDGGIQHLKKLKTLPNVKEAISKWGRKEYNIILTTGRRESTRAQTERQLAEAGIIYDQLIMGIGGGSRVLINNLKSDKKFSTAKAYNLEINSGMTEEIVNI